MKLGPFLCSLAVSGFLVGQLTVGSPAHLAAPQKVAAAPALLQFQVGQQVVGFGPTQVYFAALDHLLSVEFLGTPGVMPQRRNAPPQAVAAGLPALDQVTYPDLWPGVTLIYEGTDNGETQATYQLKPGAEVAQIRLRYNQAVALQPDGSLKFTPPTGQGTLTAAAPMAWQEIAGQRQPVSIAFALASDNTVTFQVGAHDARYPLVIAPAVYIWHTFYGGASSDSVLALALDASGNIYLAGSSLSTWQGDNNTSPLHSHNLSLDMVVVKLNKAGSYQWHTFYGGAYEESAYALAVDNDGNIYVAGNSTASWQGDNNTPPLHPYTSYRDIFILKLNATGNYQWHTFYGANSDDEAWGLLVTSNAHVIVTGYSNYPWLGDGNTNPLHAHNGGGASDITVLQLSPTGAYEWHTFYGGASYEFGYDIAKDSNGNLYIAGNSYTTWQGAGNANPLHAFGGGTSDIVLLKLNAAGGYQWHTFYGGTRSDYAAEVVTDASGNVYAVGYSYGTWQGDNDTAPLHGHSGGILDVAIIKLNSAGSYGWHTFYGSSGPGLALAIDPSANIYIGGFSSATWQADGNASPLHPYNSAEDSFLIKLTSTGGYQWHTFYGGADNDSVMTLAVDNSGNLYAGGYSMITWQGEADVSPLHAHDGNGSDQLVLRLAQPATAHQLFIPLVGR